MKIRLRLHYSPLLDRYKAQLESHFNCVYDTKCITQISSWFNKVQICFMSL